MVVSCNVSGRFEISVIAGVNAVDIILAVFAVVVVMIVVVVLVLVCGWVKALGRRRRHVVVVVVVVTGLAGARLHLVVGSGVAGFVLVGMA